MDDFLAAIGDRSGGLLDEAGALLARAFDWLTEAGPQLLVEAVTALQERASDHPIVAVAAAISVFLALLVSRDILVTIAASFFVIAAVAGTEPVMDPLARAVFPFGTFAALILVLVAIRSLRRRNARLSDSKTETEAKLEALREKYEAEVRWRMIDRRPQPPEELRRVPPSSEAAEPDREDVPR